MILSRKFLPRLRLQRNTWSCGPCALRHAMLCYGHVASIKNVCTIAALDHDFPFDDCDTTPNLRNAAYLSGFTLDQNLYESHALAKLAIRNLIDAKVPVLVCIDQWSHWIAVVGASARHVTMIDSSRPGPLVQRLTWDTFLSRASKWRPTRNRFDLYPLRLAGAKDGRMLSDSEAP